MGRLVQSDGENLHIAHVGVWAPGYEILNKNSESSRLCEVWWSLLNANVWEPGVSGWRETVNDFAEWLQPTGALDAYGKDELVAHGGKVWRSLIAANVWEPGVSGWRESVLMPPSGEIPLPPAWVQPTGGHDAYNLGDRVTHNGQIWVSTINANVWEPGVYGWEVE